MDIKRLLDIWNKSRYNRLWIFSMVVVRDDREYINPVGIYHKGQKILHGGEISVNDYLSDIYKDSLFFIEDKNNRDDYITVYEITKKSYIKDLLKEEENE